MTAQREILWNVPSSLILAVYLVSAVSLAWIVFWFVNRSKLWRQGRLSLRETSWKEACGRLASYLLTHRTIRRDPYAGVMHTLIFWGFVVLVIATILVGIQHHLHVEFLTGNIYLVFSLCADLGGVAFSVGLVMALWRRRRTLSQSRLMRTLTTRWMLWLMLSLGLSGFLVEAARIAHDFPAFEVWSPVGYGLAQLLASLSLDGEMATVLHRWAWIGHAGLVFVFFAIIPLTLMRHIVLGAYSVAHPAGRPGVLSSPQLLSLDVLPNTGNRPALWEQQLTDFRQIDLLQADACLTCGRCNEVCPADAAGKPLQPRSIVLAVRDLVEQSIGRNKSSEPEPNSSHLDDALWSCTSCNACDTACPVNINIVEKIVTLRRELVTNSAIPKTASEALESTAQKFNPFGRPNSARMEWASGLNVPVASEGEHVDLLYWVGCSGAFDPAGKEVSRAMIHILNHMKVNYRVLGCRERCTGDPARRLGEESLWSELAETNRQTFAEHRVKTILTQCPHCLNSIRNEYPGIPADTNVVHHSQWLRDQLNDGSLTLSSRLNEQLTFHDPCYLARANNEVDAPREILEVIASDGLVEMTPNKTESFCCGGGGGQMWLDVRGETRVENIRASHAEESGTQTVATACPFCRVMLEAGRTSLEEDQGNWRVKDLAELIVEHL